jgi:hypothetical protein
LDASRPTNARPPSATIEVDAWFFATVDFTAPVRRLPPSARARDLTVAEATVKELLRVSLSDALELTILFARKDLRRHPRVAARWVLRYLEEERPETRSTKRLWPRPVSPPCPVAASSRQCRPSTMGETATSRRRAQGIA